MPIAAVARSKQTAGSRLIIVPAALAAAMLLLVGCELPGFSQSDDDSMESRQESPPAAEPLTEAELVGRAQYLMAELGYKPGPADGKPGPRTSRAVMAYQNDVDMRPDGIIDRRLIRWLERSIREREAEVAQVAEPEEPSTPEPEPTGPAVRLSRQSLPLYEIGSTYVYSDGRVEEVVSLKGSIVRWSGRDGTKYSSDRNFLVPWSYWRSATERGTSEVDKDPERLWPLASDRPVSYSAKVTIQDQDNTNSVVESLESWNCRLVGAETLAVMAGTFDTFKLECDRKTAGTEPNLKRIWYYAPEVRHFVRRDDIYKSGDRSRLVELVAIRPGAQDWPPITRAALDRAVQHTLDNGPNGEAEAWSSSGVDTKVTITPTSRFENARGQPCRTFLLTWTSPDSTRHYPGAACRNSQGAWEIPGLEGGSDNNLAISRSLS